MGAARTAVHALLDRMRSGRIDIRESWTGGSTSLGPANATRRGRIEVHDPAFYGDLLRGRSVGLGESYAAGRWDSPDLVALLRVAAVEIARLDPIRRRLSPAARPLSRLSRLPMLNTRRGARRNISAHYDLGNDLFRTFLDTELMMYSSALYRDSGETLERAQRNKVERICETLDLGPRDHLLEIGTGWGGLAAYAARTRGCRVTTTTISREQRAHAEARVRAEGLEDRVTVLGTDYRDLSGRYDKLVSVEMIEAVGWEYFDLFFRRCSELLEPDGLMFLQAICIDDRAYEAEKAGRSFANQLIFPGGCLPSPLVIQRSLAAETDMRPVWLEDITPSYALTLAEWRRRFRAAEPRLAELGYDRRFRRLWELYLSYSEAGFRESRITDLQVVFAKPGWSGTVPTAPAAEPVEERRHPLAPV